MSIKCYAKTTNNGPFVIDRKLPAALFNRTPGAMELLVDTNIDEKKPLQFQTPDEAEDFLLRRLTREEISAYEWHIIPDPDHDTTLRRIA